jgi:two-component system, LytTR family, response regulator
MDNTKLRTYLVDDEDLAIQRLKRLLTSFPDLEIVDTATDPSVALDFLNSEAVDVLFLDIQMPVMNGFELLSRLDEQPCVIFTTAFDEYALRAFEVNSIDYLVKPVDTELLERAIGKLCRMRPVAKAQWQQEEGVAAILRELAVTLRNPRPEYLRRIASRVGERITFVDLSTVAYFVAKDKLTYAVVKGHQHCVDQTIAELEQRLDPAAFVRIHRAVLLNVDFIQEVNSWFAGKVVVSLKDGARTELTVARDRVRLLKDRLGI